MPLTFEQLKAQMKDDAERAMLEKVINEHKDEIANLEAMATRGEEYEAWRKDPRGLALRDAALAENPTLKAERDRLKAELDAAQKKLTALESVKPGDIDENGNPKPATFDLAKLTESVIAQAKLSGQLISKADAEAMALRYAQEKANEAQQNILTRGFPEMKGIIDAARRYERDFPGEQLDEAKLAEAIRSTGNVQLAYQQLTAPKYKAKQEAETAAEIEKRAQEKADKLVAEKMATLGNMYSPQDQGGSGMPWNGDGVSTARAAVTPLDQIPKDIDIKRQPGVLAAAVADKWKADIAAGKVLQ